MGLARLLVLEKLPKTHDREQYADKRRAERGRPPVNRYSRNQHRMYGNLKDDQEDEVAEWVEEDQISNYHTMVVPYGKKFNAHKIERLLYTKDLLLNSEWNRPKDREVNLHRHPCFFGTAEDVLGDCCGFCPVPETEEELEIAAEESKLYITGPLTFIKDDPGRQEIGSFNPITTDDWTEMAYVGNTQMLCQAIVDGDLDYIRGWCEQEGNDVNTRDYVGRTPLHLAVINGKIDVVKLLVDNGARLIARLLDGRCALHIAAQFGNIELVKILMEKSLANEEEEDAKAEKLKASKKATGDVEGDSQTKDKARVKDDEASESDDSESSGMEVESEEEEEDDDDDDADSETQGFTKVKKEKEEVKPEESNDIPEDDAEEPDFYDINVVAWDLQCTPLHFAIMGGHIPMIRLLVEEYGADVLLPIKLAASDRYSTKRAILPLVLAMSSPPENSKEVAKVLLELGATSAQADMDHFTALHYIVERNNLDLLDILIKNDGPAAQSVLNHIPIGHSNCGQPALVLALQRGYEEMSAKLLSLGAKPSIEFDDWIKPYISRVEYAKNWTHEQNMKTFENYCSQPIIHAAVHDLPKIMKELLAKGADPNTLTNSAKVIIREPQYSSWRTGHSVLDIVLQKLEKLREFTAEKQVGEKEKPATLKDESYYLQDLKPGTYKYWTAQNRYKSVKAENDAEWELYNKRTALEKVSEAAKEAKKAAVDALIDDFEEVRKILVDSGAKSFKTLHPTLPSNSRGLNVAYHDSNHTSNKTPYETYFTFNLPDLTNSQKEGYFRLFEAVWSNDIDEVKALTLGSWKSEDGTENIPLKMAVQDTVSRPAYNYYSTDKGQKPFSGMSPFSLAVLRGPSHQKMAKAIVEIALAQYEPEDNAGKKSKWNIEFGDDSDYYSDSDSDNSIQLHSELIDDVYTIDNVAAVSTVIKSHVKPLDMLMWQCNAPWFLKDGNDDNDSTLVGHAIAADDIGLLRFLYQIAEEQATHFPDETESPCSKITKDSFDMAISKGRTAILGEMIKKTGVGIPLDQLVEKTGISIQEKPKYYQGLNVGGKKNAAWAEAANPNAHHQNYSSIEKTSPLLKAAKMGSLESVQWFMSELPAIKYVEFAATHQEDKRVQVLSKSEDGFDKTITNWLSMRHELVLHCAIMWSPAVPASFPQYIALLKYLINTDPSLLEQRSVGGFTPLHLSCTLKHDFIISLLLDSGANPRARDSAGKNILHHLLHTFFSADDAPKLRDILALFKPSDIASMLLERNAAGLTPLASWQNGSTTDSLAIVSQLTAHAAGQNLTVMNGAGDLPVHVAIKQGRALQVRHFLALAPQTLGWENATGITALELAQGVVLGRIAREAVDLGGVGGGEYVDGSMPAIVSRGLESFEPKGEGEEDELAGLGSAGGSDRVLEVCMEVKEKLEAEGGMKRRLVTLSEANEVARRAVEAQRREEEEKREHQSSYYGTRKASVGKAKEWDEVAEWMERNVMTW